MNPVKQLLAVQKENEELKAKLSSQPAATTTSTGPDVLAELTTGLQAFGTQLETIAKSVQSLGEEVKTIKAEKADFAGAVAKQAALTVAGITGTRPPIRVGEGEPAPGANSVFDEYLEIKKTNPTGAARFWNQHRAELRRIIS